MATVFKRGGRSNKSGYYYVAWHEHTAAGRRRRTKCVKTTDKGKAERIAAKLEGEAALRREGIVDPALDAIGRESQRSLESHLADYENKLRAANRTDKHVAATMKFIRWVAGFAGFQTPAQISADGVTRYAAKLRGEDNSARTVGAHLTAIKGFTRWLVEHQKLPRDPLASVHVPNPKADRRRERRLLLPEEWRLLDAATLAGQDREGMTGADRSLLYRTALQTGLRANELRSLTRGRLFLSASPPYILCKAGSTKNRQEARQFITLDLAADLRAAVALKSPKAPVFNMPHESNLARMLRADLEDARRAWLKEVIGEPDQYAKREQSDFLLATSHDGETLDFHALRHACGAWLAMAGAHPKTVQVVMRHSAITLTMDTYGHLFPGQEADAVNRLRGMMNPPPAALTLGS